MKKNIFSALLCAMAIVTVAACNKPEEKFDQQDKIHTVTFKAQAPSVSETKTAIMLQMVPDWRNTDVNDVHIFETETASSGNAYFMEASKVEMTTPVDGTWERAYFYAEFDNATVIVNPPSALTKAGSTFAYTAIMATRENDKYLVPSVQYPHVESLMDPKADFLVGKCPATYSSSRHEQRVNLDFLRPVALSRLMITNLGGSKIESVKINCVQNSNDYNGIITGEVEYAGVDFEAGTAAFQANDSSYELTLSYPNGRDIAPITYVYMVTVPGKKSVKSIEVVTDKYIYTKTYANPAPLTFYASEFINIAMDMTVKEGGNTTRVERAALEMEYEDNNGDSVSEVVYDIYNNEVAAFGAVAPSLYISDKASAGVVTYSSSNENVATVDENGNVTLTGNTGETTITATASGDGQHYTESSASYKLTVVSSAPEVTYYKANSIDAGYDYLIVSAANALRLSGEDIGAVEVTVDDQAGTASLVPVEGILWTAAAVSESLADYGTHTFSQDNSHLTRYSDSGSYQLVASDGAVDKYMAWNYDGTNFWNTSIYESTITDFYAYFNEGWRIASSGYGATALYTDRQPQVISFDEEKVTINLIDFGGNKFTQAVNGAQTNVTYTSSNTTVATVNNSGEVTIKGTGTAVITAAAAASADWQGAVASYTLSVIITDDDATSYKKVTSADELYADAKYLIVFEGLEGDEDDGDPKVFYPVLNSDGNTLVKNASSALDVTIENGTITSDDFAACELTLEDGFYLMADEAGKFIYPSGTSGGSGTLSAESTASTKLNITFDNGIAQIKAANGSNYFVWSVSSHYFSSNATISGQYSTGICLYRLEDGLKSQSISFSADEAVYDVFNGAWEDGKGIPALSGAQSDVTYSSSDESVAIVNPATGAITIMPDVKKGDKAVITATAEQDDEWRSATASYTITIISSEPTVMTKYYKVDEIVAGQTYIVVSDGQAMTIDGADLGVAAVTDVDGVIETDDDLALWTAAEHVEYYSGTSAAGHFTLKSGDNYLQRHSDSGTQTVVAGGVPSTGKYYVWEYDGSHLYHISSSSNTFYMGYSSGWKFNYQSPYYTAALYSTTKPLTKQTIAFSGANAVYDIATSSWTTAVPTLSEAATTVTYSSSNESVATVNPSTGAVTIAAGAKKGDTAVITAAAAQTAEFAEATASYTISIVDNSAPASTYFKVTSADDLVAGAKYLVVFEGLAGDTDGDGDPKVFDPVLNDAGTQFAKATASALDVTIAGEAITSSELDDCQFTLENGYYLKANKANKYIYPGSSGSSSVLLAESSASNALSISFNSGIAEIKNGSRYIVWSTSSHYFSCNSSVSSSYSTGICLYMLDNGSPRPQTIAFSSSSVSINIYGQTTPVSLGTAAPTLSGAKTAVQYDSSDKSVATVNASGAVSVLKAGTTKITAQAQSGEAGGKQYNASNVAEYTLTVTDEEVTAYYQKVTSQSEVAQDGTYIIVNEENSKLFKPVLASGNATFSTDSENAIDVTISSNTIASTPTVDACQIVLKNADGNGKFALWVPAVSNYLMVYNGSAFKADATDDGYRSTFSVTSSGISIYRDSSHYIRYSASSSAFQAGSNSNNIALYKLVDGTAPEPLDPVTYTLIEGDANLVSGTYVIADKTDTYLLNASNSNNGGYSTINSTTGVSKSGSTITLAGDIAEAHEFVITRTGDNLTIKQVGGSHAGQYLFASASVTNSYMGFQSSAATFVINPQTGTDLIYFSTTKSSSDPTEYLYKKAADSYFKLGQSGAPGGSDAGVLLYKKN